MSKKPLPDTTLIVVEVPSCGVGAPTPTKVHRLAQGAPLRGAGPRHPVDAIRHHRDRRPALRRQDPC